MKHKMKIDRPPFTPDEHIACVVRLREIENELQHIRSELLHRYDLPDSIWAIQKKLSSFRDEVTELHYTRGLYERLAALPRVVYIK